MDNKQQNLHVNEHEIEQRIDNLRFELDKIDIEIIQKYLKINILNFKKMDLTDFWELKFFYGRKVF